jgi:uncharacterized membrane protein
VENQQRHPAIQIIDRHFWAIVVAILILSLGFRLPGLASRSLWIDELFSQWFAARSLTELWHDVPFYETHPPFYYTLLKSWTLLFGKSELGLRSLSLVASLATVGVVAISGRLIHIGALGKSVGLLAATLLAVNFASIREAQNTRPYSLQIFLCTVAIMAALMLVQRLQRQAGPEQGTRHWRAVALTLGLSAGMGLWIHNTGLFVAFGIWSGLALSLCVTSANQRWRNFLIFAAAGILSFLLWAPYLPLFIGQSRAFAGLAFWLTPKNSDLYSAWMLISGDSVPLLLVTLALLALGLFRLGKQSLPLALLAAAILLVPLFSMLAVSFAFKPIYIQRLFAWMVPLSLFVMAFGILTVTQRWWPRLVLASAAIIVSAVISIQDFSRPIDDWKSIVAEIARNARPNDVVIAVPAEGSIAVDYYASRQPRFPPVVCVPGCYPQRNLPRTYISNLGAPMIVEADREIIDRALKTYDRVWLVEVSVALYDPKSIVRSRIAASRTFVRYYGNSLARVDLFE